MDAIEQIQQLSAERHRLWRVAGIGRASDEQRRRISEITHRLENLWDSHRREIASQRFRQETGSFPAYNAPEPSNTKGRRAA